MKSSVAKKIAFLGIVSLIALFVWYYGFLDWFTVDTIKKYNTELDFFVQYHYVATVLVYLLIYIIVAGTATPLAAFLTVVGGALFGTFMGAVYANIAATVGATICFLMARYFFGNWIQAKYGKKLEKFNRLVESEGAYYLISLHLMSWVPFFLINTLAGLTKVSTWTFIWTTLVGIIPGSLVFAFAGSQLHAITSIRDIISGKILLAFGLLALLALMPVAIIRYRKWRNAVVEEVEL